MADTVQNGTGGVIGSDTKFSTNGPVSPTTDISSTDNLSILGDGAFHPLHVSTAWLDQQVPPKVNVQDEGVAVAGNPHKTLNFTGTGVTVTDAGGGVATVSIPGVSPGTPPSGIVVIAGQSNAIGNIGQANTFYVDPGFDSVTPYAPVTMQETWADNPDNPLVFTHVTPTETLRPYGPDGGGANMGPELSLGRALVQGGMQTVFVGKFAVSNSGLEAHWLPSSAYPALPLGGPNLFAQFVTYIKNLVATTGLPLVAVVWVQGETDAITNGPAGNYTANLHAFVAALRAQLGNFAFVFNRLDQQDDVVALPFKVLVASRQVDYVNSDPVSSMVYCDDLASVAGVGTPDHFDGPDLWTLGNRLAQGVLKLLPVPTGDPTPTYLGADNGVYGAATTLKPKWGCPDGYRAGDVALLVVTSFALNAAITLDDAQGFALVAQQQSATGGAFQNTAVYVAVATSDNMTAPTVSNTNQELAARIFVFRGVDPVAPIDTFASYHNNANAAAFAIPGATTLTNHSLIANILGSAVGAFPEPIVGLANADLASLTLQQNSTYHIGLPSNPQNITLITGVKNVVGAYGATTGAYASGTDPRGVICGFTVALKPIGNPP